MPHISRRTFLELASAAVITGCSERTNSFMRGNVPLLAFSDIHFNPFCANDPKVFQALDAADASQWQGIFEAAEIPAVSIAGADTNYPLLKLALASVRQNLGASQVAIYTGDLLGHNIAGLYQTASGSSDPAPNCILYRQNRDVCDAADPCRGGNHPGPLRRRQLRFVHRLWSGQQFPGQ